MTRHVETMRVILTVKCVSRWAKKGEQKKDFVSGKGQQSDHR